MEETKALPTVPESEEQKIVKMLQEIANTSLSQRKEIIHQEIIKENQKSKYYTEDNMSIIKVKEYLTFPWTMNYRWLDLLFDKCSNRFYDLLLGYKSMVFGRIDNLGKKEENCGLADVHVFIDDKNKLHIDIVSNFEMNDHDVKATKACLDEGYDMEVKAYEKRQADKARREERKKRDLKKGK